MLVNGVVSQSTPGWSQTVTGGPDPVLTHERDQEVITVTARRVQATSTLSWVRDAALKNQDGRFGRLQGQPLIDARSVVANATDSVADITEFEQVTDELQVTGTWDNPEVDDDQPVAVVSKTGVPTCWAVQLTS